METKSTNWDKKTEVIKGNFGENIIRKYLEDKGFVIYEPITDKSHAFDKLAIKDKEQMILIEVKTKARRNKYPDTGININHYENYKKISKKHNLPIFLFFVDEMLGKIYGNTLQKLEEEIIIKSVKYPLFWNNIIYFPVAKMKDIYKLNSEEIAFLKKNSTRNYDYLL